jgi:ribosomal protein S18 acetylase RimI-like enzyme
MKSEEGLVLVALDGTKVVGFSLAELRGPSPGYKRDQYGIIDTTAVTESYRRKGIGEKMVREAMKWFQLKNVDRVELETAAENLVANSFWQKQGFTVYRHRLFKGIK